MFFNKTVLDNGITVITESIPSVRSITLGLWFRVGSRDELPEEAGMSHFMEHMMFKGTETRDYAAISSAFEGLGAELNAFTSKEYTCYYARFVDEKLEDIIDIYGDMVENSLYDQNAIDSEREVVIEEIARSEDTPDDHIYDVFGEALFPKHVIGRPVIGTRDIVGGFTHEDCMAYHAKHYNTGNLIIVAAGNVDHAAFVGLIKKRFSQLEQGVRKERAAFSDDAPRSTSFLHKDTEQAHVMYGMRSLAGNDPDRYALSVLDAVLGGGMSSRLFTEVREKRGLAYAVYTNNAPFQGTGQFAVYAGTRPDNLEEVVEIIKREVSKVAEENITSAELERVREFITGQLILSMESTRTHMIRLGRNASCDIDLNSLDDTIEAYRSVTLEDVSRVAFRVLTGPATLAVISPHSVDELNAMLA